MANDGTITEVTGLTVEDVVKMQDEQNPGLAKEITDSDKTPEQKELEAKEAETKAKEEADKLEAKKAEDKAKEDAEKAKEGDASKNKDDEEPDVVRELKEQNIIMKESLQKVTKDYERLMKTMIDKGVITEDEVNKFKEESDKAQALIVERQEKLNEMVSIMEVNPSYADVRQVCTQNNLDDIIDAFSRFYVKENGGKVAEVAAQMEADIWKEANPYKKIYELVKTYHPKYKKTEDDDKTKADAKKKADEEAEAKKKEEAEKGKKKEAVDTNDSAAKIGDGGSGAGATGWTAARIDALPEDELHTVPKDIYEKYLANQLA